MQITHIAGVVIEASILCIGIPVMLGEHRKWQRAHGIAPKRPARVRFFMWLQRRREKRRARHLQRLEMARLVHLRDAISLANETMRLSRKWEE